MKKVLYISMPFASPSWGSLALSTLKEIGERDGISSKILYLNITFAKMLGERRYNTLRESLDAELCFTWSLFPFTSPEEVWRRYTDCVRGARDEGVLADLGRAFIEIAGHHAPRLLQDAMEAIDWDLYDIVGFTTGYHQLTASLAMAKRIRESFPDKTIVFGGASCEGAMGRALFDAFPFIDVVVGGEADRLITPLIRKLRNGEAVDALPGVSARKKAALSVMGEQRVEAPVFESPVIPNYDDFFEQVQGLEPEDGIRIPFESSRGCWWGKKHLCTFCGLNGATLDYRRKSPEFVLREILTQHQRYGAKRFMAADNILDMGAFQTLLPGFSAMHAEHGFEFFYEVKSNLRTDQVAALSNAGIVEIQPGIESFSDHILEVMDKGCTGLNQVRVLRDFMSHRIQARYGILWGNPGERAEDYLEMARIVPYLKHLLPPRYVTPVCLQRFSPYFLRPESFGIRNVRPNPIYEVMFAGQPLDYQSLAYNFSYDHDFDSDSTLRAAVTALLDAIEEWRRDYRPLSLVCSESDSTLYVADCRDGDIEILRFTGTEMKILIHCETPCRLPDLEKAFPEVSAAWIAGFLGALVARRIVLQWPNTGGDRFLALPIKVTEQDFYALALKPGADRCNTECYERQSGLAGFAVKGVAGNVPHPAHVDSDRREDPHGALRAAQPLVAR
jgi:ribosomal peptide maturation radical SAM protein 1